MHGRRNGSSWTSRAVAVQKNLKIFHLGSLDGIFDAGSTNAGNGRQAARSASHLQSAAASAFASGSLGQSALFRIATRHCIAI